MQGKSAHPVHVRDYLDAADDLAQVTGDRGLQGQYGEGAFLGGGTHRGDLLVIGDHLLGENEVSL
ncbi:Uncharacterised protein [Mycobacteroides abscessus subsp. abscessus]|nr:Uncharacterised protein [Mycobacteroides abscessus subsp. abscessus]